MIAALLMLAQIVSAPAEPKPISTTIAAIRANPTKFEGKIVRLHGWVNKCESATCDIDELPATSPGGAGASLSIGKDPKFDATIKPLVPTYVELDATVGDSCIVVPCLDRGSALTVVRLRGIVDPTVPPPED